MPSIEHDTAHDIARRVFGFGLMAGIDALDRSENSVWAVGARYGVMASWTVSRRGLKIDLDTHARLLMASPHAVTDACHHFKRNAVGDYTPDPKVAGFPTYEAAKPAVIPQAL